LGVGSSTFIDDVPVRALPLIARHERGDVVLHHAHQRRVVVDRVNPVRELRVPHQRMAAHLLAILGGEVGNLIRSAEAELSAIGLRGIPLHGVLRRDGSELGALDDVLLGVVVADGQRSTNVRPAARNHGGIEGRGLTGPKTKSGDGRRAAGQSQSGGESREQHRQSLRHKANLYTAMLSF
jgi:hypothetical protein